MNRTPLNAAAATTVALLATLTTLGLGTPPALGSPLPEKLVPAGSIASGELRNPRGLAVQTDPASPEDGDVYVADLGNHRIQMFTPNGEFVLMFGREVNETTGGGVCTHEEQVTKAVKCKPGSEATAPGAFSQPLSIAVDPVTGDVYVAEYNLAGENFGLRVQKFTGEGQFLLEIGREVNQTTKGNLCTREEELKEAVKCEGPASPVVGSSEPGAFNFEQSAGLIAAGGKEDLLYVGDEHRVQEFDSTGHPKGEIPLTSISEEPRSNVHALVLNQETGNLFLTYHAPFSGDGAGNLIELEADNLVHEFDASGTEIDDLAIRSQEAEQRFTPSGLSMVALGIDGEGHLAGLQDAKDESGAYVYFFGALYDGSTGRRFSEFAFPQETRIEAIGFGAQGELFAVEAIKDEVLRYTPKAIAALELASHECVPGGESGTSVAFSCTLKGEVDPEGVSETEALFEYGQTVNLGESTPVRPVATQGPVQATVSLPPNATYQYRLAGSDHNVPAPERFFSEAATLRTETVAPRVPGAPLAPFVRESAATVHAELNPENASSEYFVEYAQSPAALAACPTPVQGTSCAGVAHTTAQRSGTYGLVGGTFEVSGLQPGTTYYDRLFAESSNSAEPAEKFRTVGPVGSFTTAATPTPSVETGGYSAVGVTTASVSGTVSPNGTPTAYYLELGVYNGAATQYSSVYSGEAGSGTSTVPVSLGLTGLEPGTTYAYRLAISSGYIDNGSHSLQGAPVTFTTAGIPAVLSSPAAPGLLATPNIAFPAKPTAATTSAKRLTKAQKRAAALKACARDRSKLRRAACERSVNRRYGTQKLRKSRNG